jgi:hypothetical protein
MMDNQKMYDRSVLMIKDLGDKDKPRAFMNFIKGITSNGLYYKAMGYIPEYTSSANELDLYTEIIKAEIVRQDKVLPYKDRRLKDDDNEFYDFNGRGDYEDGFAFKNDLIDE